MRWTKINKIPWHRKPIWVKRFAIIPTDLTNGEVVWLEWYYVYKTWDKYKQTRTTWWKASKPERLSPDEEWEKYYYVLKRQGYVD